MLLSKYSYWIDGCRIELSLLVAKLSAGDIKIKFMTLKSIEGQNRSTEGCSKLKRSVDMTSSGMNGLNIRTNASPNGTGPGVRRSKRPLLALKAFHH